MVSRLVPGGVLAALAGAAMMIAASSSPSSAFTLVLAFARTACRERRPPGSLLAPLGLASGLGLASPVGLGLASPVASGLPPLAALLVGPVGLPLPLGLSEPQ